MKKILIVGDENATSLMENFEKMKTQMHLDIEHVNIAFMKLGVSVREASEALISLSTMNKFMVMDKTIVADSFIEESALISKKEWKKLKKNLEKINSNLRTKSQKEIWCNKWDKKIKRKL